MRVGREQKSQQDSGKAACHVFVTALQQECSHTPYVSFIRLRALRDERESQRNKDSTPNAQRFPKQTGYYEMRISVEATQDGQTDGQTDR